MADNSTLVYYTARQIAELFGTSADRIIDLIHAGHLVGIDIRAPASRRATWRISQSALDDFLARRASQGPARPRRKTTAKYVHTYY
jgi:excisionase family DNA binding protein